MKAEEYRKKTKEELLKLKSELGLSLMKSRNAWSAERERARNEGRIAKGSKMIKNLKREIAKINTVLGENERNNK